MKQQKLDEMAKSVSKNSFTEKQLAQIQVVVKYIQYRANISKNISRRKSNKQIIFLMQFLNQSVKAYDGEIIKKKVKLCDESQCSTIINENSNSLDSLSTLSKTISRVINKPSLRERFQHLNSSQSIKDSRYFLLVSILGLIDKQVLFLKQRRESLFWPNIQKCCQDSASQNISIKQLQEIMQVWSESYSVSWERFEKQQGKYELFIKFPDKQLLNSIELNLRREKFTKKLTDYLLTNGDYIEPANLPSKPIFQNNSIGKESLLLNKLELIKPSLSVSINVTKIFSDKKESNKELSSVSLKLIEKIREKKQQEKLLQDAQELTTGKKQVSSKKQQILIASMLHQYYYQRDVSNMFLANVIKYIHEHNKSMLMGDGEIEQTILDLVQGTENWLTMIENANGRLLRLNKEQELPSIINQLSQQ